MLSTSAIVARIRAKAPTEDDARNGFDFDDDIARAVIDGVCATRARATPYDAVVSLNARGTSRARARNDGEWSYDEHVVNLIEIYVAKFPRVVKSFARSAFVDGDGRARASKFVRGCERSDVEDVTRWRMENLPEDLLRLDDERTGGGREGAEILEGRGRVATKREKTPAPAKPPAAPAKPPAKPAPPAAKPAPPAVKIEAVPATPAWGKAPVVVKGKGQTTAIAVTGGTAVGTNLRDIMLAESRRAPSASASARASANESQRVKPAAPKLPIITGESLRLESRRSAMDKFGKVRCQVCGKSFKAYDALEQHIGVAHYGLNNPYAKVLEAAQIAAGIIPSAKEQESRVALKLGDLVSSKSKTSNSMVNSLAAYFKTETRAPKRIEKKDGISHGGVMVKSTNTASSTGVVLKRGKEREGGKKKKRSTLKKIILRERATRVQHENALTPGAEDADEVEVEVEVRVGWIYVQINFDGDAIKVNLVYMERDDDDSDDGNDDSSDDGEEDEGKTFNGEAQTSSQANEAVEERTTQVQEKLNSLAARVPAGAWSVRNFLDVFNGVPEKPVAKPPKVKEQTRICDVCNVSCYGNLAWEGHVKGKMHLKKITIRDDVATAVKVKATSKTFVGIDAEDIRYAEQVITNDLNSSATTLLKKLKGFQDRLYHTDKIKAKMRRRLLYGLREVAKSVNVKTSKAIIIAPNIEKIESEGGLDDRIDQIIAEARGNDIPIVFALTKRRIGNALGVNGVISMVSILDYNGADDEFKITLKHAAEGRALYSKVQKGDARIQDIAEEPQTRQSPASVLNVEAAAFEPRPAAHS